MADIDEIFWPGGRINKRWNHNTTPGTYSEYAEDGTLLLQRTFTAEEQAMSDARKLTDLADGNDSATSSRLVSIDFPAMQAIIADTNANINSNPATRIKDIARAVRRIIRRVEHLTDGTE